MLDVNKLYRYALEKENPKPSHRLTRFARDGSELSARAINLLQFELEQNGRKKVDSYAKLKAQRALEGEVANILMDAHYFDIYGPEASKAANRTVRLSRRYRELRYILRWVYGGPEHAELSDCSELLGTAYGQTVRSGHWTEFERLLRETEKRIEDHERKLMETDDSRCFIVDDPDGELEFLDEALAFMSCMLDEMSSAACSIERRQCLMSYVMSCASMIGSDGSGANGMTIGQNKTMPQELKELAVKIQQRKDM